ncbi:MAG: NAD(+)/NADH kinase, partial [Thaumarchaeota archaeon]|nr:NAD(+)/NADH kinase [Nitrososphaerota archaeon]
MSHKTKPKPVDCIIVLGGDRGVRNYFRHTLDALTPVLGIGEAEASGFLAQIELKEFPTYLKRLKKQDFVIDEV